MKKRLIIYYSLVFLLMLCCTAMMAQKTPDAIAQSFIEYRKSNPMEKLFVHTDKSFYMAGEIIWFKVYATDALENKPVDFSKISYVELLTKEHKPVLQAKIGMGEEGSGSGSFQLPYSVNSGTYVLRAYTNWMKNVSADYFFEKDITIVNALKKPDWPTADAVAYDIQFFPEGGNLVNGIQGKVAVKIVDSHGKSINCSGSILNQRNDVVAKFSTTHFGMGHFDLTPDAGERYYAVITTKDGNITAKAFPAVATAGMTMGLTETGNGKLTLTIQSKNAGQIASLIVRTRGAVKLNVTRELFNNKTEIEIDKKQLGDGISQFTVYNASSQPVCERLYFKKPEALSIAAKPDASTYGARKKVTIDVSTNDAKQLPASGNLSMSVYLLDSLQSLESADILSYLWLQSDLRGNIESPDYYFTGGKDAEDAADDLVLTQGWRRFNPNNVSEKPTGEPEYLAEIEGHIINAKLTDKRNGQPGENITAYLSVPAERSLFTNTLSGKNGSARFLLKNFYGGNEIVVQTNNNTDSNYRIDIASPFSERFSSREVSGFRLQEDKAPLLLSHSIYAQAGNAYYADKQQKFLYPRGIDTTAFYGNPDRLYYLDDYTRFITMEEVMREYILDVRVRKNNDHFSYRVFNKPFETFFETAPLLLIDGVPVFDVDKIIAFDPLKIKRIDVVTHKFYQQNLTHDGIINYSTYQGDLAGYQLEPNALIVEYEGLQLQREFYSPVYETVSATSNRLPDFRNVLYWSPEVHTDKNGRKQVSFYTADIPGTYGVVIQGITVSGLAGSKTVTFSVTK